MHLFQPGAGSFCLLGPLGSTRGLLGRTHTHTHAETRAHARRHRNRPTNSGAHSLDLDEHGPACTCVHMRIKHANSATVRTTLGATALGEGLQGVHVWSPPTLKGSRQDGLRLTGGCRTGDLNPRQGVHSLVYTCASAFASPTSFLMFKARKVPRKHQTGQGAQEEEVTQPVAIRACLTGRPLGGGVGGFTENNKGMGGCGDRVNRAC